MARPSGGSPSAPRAPAPVGAILAGGRDRVESPARAAAQGPGGRLAPTLADGVAWAMRNALLLVIGVWLGGCYPVRFEGANPPLVDFAQLADPARAEGWLDDRVRFYAVVTGFQSLPTPWFQGQRMVGATVYRVRMDRQDPPLPGRCDFTVRSGAVSALVPRGLARQWAGRSPDTVFVFTGRVERRELGAPGWSPTPVWLAIDGMTPMGTCQRPHPLVAPPGRTQVP